MKEQQVDYIVEHIDELDIEKEVLDHLKGEEEGGTGQATGEVADEFADAEV